jgi:hypothetical protein
MLAIEKKQRGTHYKKVCIMFLGIPCIHWYVSKKN